MNLAWLLAVPLLGVLALLQSTVLRQMTFLDGGFDLLLLVVLCWSLLRPDEGLVWAVAAGMFSDIFSGGPFGLTSVAYLLAAFVAGQVHGRLWRNSPLAVMSIVLLGTVLSHLALIAMLILLGHPIDVGYSLAFITLPTAFLDTVIAIPVYLSLRRLHRALLPPAALLEEEEE